MSETKISNRWTEVYHQCQEFIAHPGEPSTKPVEWTISLIEELSHVEAQVRMLRDALLRVRPDLEYKRDHSQTAIGRKNAARSIEIADAALAEAKEDL